MTLEKEMQQKALHEIEQIPEVERSMIHLLWKAEIFRKQGRIEEAIPIYKQLSRQKQYPQIQKIAIFFTTMEPK